MVGVLPVFRREIGVLVSDLETAPVLCRTGVLGPGVLEVAGVLGPGDAVLLVAEAAFLVVAGEAVLAVAGDAVLLVAEAAVLEVEVRGVPLIASLWVLLMEGGLIEVALLGVGVLGEMVWCLGRVTGLGDDRVVALDGLFSSDLLFDLVAISA